MEGDRTREAIHRIADTLGIPRSAFDEPVTPQAAPAYDEASQALELLTLFSAVRDPEARLACLDDLRRRADGAPQAASPSWNGHVPCP